jgi:hypothetical protein
MVEDELWTSNLELRTLKGRAKLPKAASKPGTGHIQAISRRGRGDHQVRCGVGDNADLTALIPSLVKK